MAREAPNRHEKGSKKYNEMIHTAHKKIMDSPKTLIKPVVQPKIKGGRPEYFVCPTCKKTLSGTQNTCAIICSNCHKMVFVNGKETEVANGYTGPTGSKNTD